MEDWYLQRQGHPETRHHLNTMLNNKEKLTIGRKAGGVVDIVCNGKTVSREHCILKFVDCSWQIEDLESMNGVYVNKLKILPRTPTFLALGDVLGIGALDISDPDYFVFDVCKVVLKDENENLDAAAVLLPLVKVENTLENDQNKALDDNVPALQAEACNQVEEALVSNNEQGSKTSGKVASRGKAAQVSKKDARVASTAEELKMRDPKLAQKCVVLIDKLQIDEKKKAETKSTPSKPKKVPVKGKKRVCRLVDSDDDEVSSDPVQQNSNPTRSSRSPVCWIPMDALQGKNSSRQSVDGGQEKENLVNNDVESPTLPVTTNASAGTKGKALKNPSQGDGELSKNQRYGKTSAKLDDAVASTSTSQPRQVSNFVVQKMINTANKVVVEEKISSNDGLSTEAAITVNRSTRPLVEIADDDSNDCISFQPTQNPTWEDDDDVIILSSDEETFSYPRFKVEPPDDNSKQIILSDEQKRLAVENDREHTSSSSDEGDLPFFPQLSQGILNEIAAEEAEEEAAVASTSTSSKHYLPPAANKKLHSLLASGRFRANERTTLPTEPKFISVHPNGRFPFTTAGEPLRKCNGQRFEEPAVPPKSKTPSYIAPQRTIKLVPRMPRKSVKKSSKTDSVRGELFKEYGSYCCSVKKATKRSRNSSVVHPPDSAVLATSTTSSTKTTSNQSSSSGKQSPVSRAPKPLVPNPVKAKVTKKSRGDMLLEDVVGEEQIPSEETERKKRTASSATNLSGYSIPKRPKLADSESPIPEPTIAESIETSHCPGTSYSFKQPTKRVARGTSCGQVDSDRNEPSSSTSRKPIHRPRDEALPLGRDRRHSQPFKSSTNNYRSFQQDLDGVKDGQRKVHSTSGVPRPDENAENWNNHPSNDVTLPLVNSDQERSSIPSDPPLVSSTTGHLKSGILKYGVRRNSADRFRVRFAEKDEIREIEARSPRLQATYSSKSSVRHVDVQTLKKDLMLRICNWNYNWIAEQQAAKDRDAGPPPLLGEVKAENNRILPKLAILPVLSMYNSMEAYFATFHPLMLHEIWANICKDVELERTVWDTLVHITSDTDGGCAILYCETLVSNGTPRLREWDLVTLSIPLKPNHFMKVFGIVENVEMRKITSANPANRRLLDVRKRPGNPEWRIKFKLRLKSANAPPSLDDIFTITSVTPLRSIIKQFLLHAELDCSPLCDVILHPGDLSETFKLDMVDVEGNEKLNPIQHKAVESITTTILNTPEDEPKVALLQGPPGTGKSHVIVELVLRMIFMHYEKTGCWPRILICAPSNNAVDEIATRLCKARNAINRKFQIVRIGVPSSMHSSVENISLDYLAQKVHEQNINSRESPDSPNLRNLREELKNLSKMKQNLIGSIDVANKKGDSDEARLYGRKLELLETQIEGVDRSYRECYKNHVSFFNTNRERENAKLQVVRRANVICTTLNSCRSKEMENLFQMRPGENRDPKAKFLCCIIDEASQCTEPESLTPLALGIGKLVMIGDPDQLPATVASQFALKNRFDQSLFNRFYSSRMSATGENAEPVMMLDTQYRMAPSICEWPSKYFYGGKLKTADNLLRKGPCYDYRVLNLLEGREKSDNTDGKSIMNEGEAALVAKMVDVITSSPLTRGKTIGVITFYQRQKQCIMDTLKEKKIREADRVEVNTVDSFQGREKDIVIVSCVRARDSGGDIGFIGSLQRMNVALTRAKESLIVCCHFPTLEGNEAWRNLIENARSRGVVHCVTSSYTSANLKPLLMRQS